MELFSFEMLDAYKIARKLIVEVYKIIQILPKEERFAISLQLQRSIVSVLSNIAEGSGRMALKEKTHFVEIAYGSLMEAYCQLVICSDLGYVSEDTVTALKKDFFQVARLLSGLRSSFVKRLEIKG